MAIGLIANLESPLPRALPTGTATALYCSGTAWGDGAPVRGLELLVDGVRAPLEAVAMPRFDMPVRRTGFWGVIPVQARVAGEDIVLSARAAGWSEVELGRIEVTAAATAPGRCDEDLVAICLATFEPDIELLAAQLRSLREQTYRRWTCVISDDCSSEERYAQIAALVGADSRFALSRTDSRIGFYRNFERALALAPAEAALIALSDQDDVWHPEKLGVLRANIGAATLVYSDQRLVDAGSHVLRETMWQGRANNWTNLASMLIANTVTGSSALMRREVVERALPFPDSPGVEFHDHWLALVALAAGELAFVDRPLYDYVQHRQAVLGASGGAPRRGRSRPGLPRMRAWRAAYFFGYIPGKVRSQALLQRTGDRLTPRKRKLLLRYLHGDRSLLGLAWLLLRPLRLLTGHSETLASEWDLARGLIWLLLARVVAAVPGWPERWLLDTRLPEPEHFEQRRLRRWRERI